jgi:hypothetical protein
MYITKKEVERILEVMAPFSEVDKFELDQNNSSGIGSLTTLTVPTTLYGIKGKFTIEISNLEDW